MRKICDFFMRIIFGEESLEGYYRPDADKKNIKKYVVSSVFPNKAIMDQVLNQES